MHLGLTGLYDTAPDIVISGINAGPNMGDDVLYSGTVAAAMEGRHLGYPSLAVSMNSSEQTHLQSAVKAVLHLLPLTHHYPDRSHMILNINVPNLPWEQIRGFKVTRLGRRHYSEPAIRSKDPRGKDIFWVGAVGGVADASEGTDFLAVEQGFISITPIHSDLTRYQALVSTAQWLQERSYATE